LDFTFWEHGYFFAKKFLVFGSVSLTSFPKGEISLAIEQNCSRSFSFFCHSRAGGNPVFKDYNRKRPPLQRRAGKITREVLPDLGDGFL
ncbi:MAG: hypothetical protein WCG60_00235, partial [bacterium]